MNGAWRARGRRAAFALALLLLAGPGLAAFEVRDPGEPLPTLTLQDLDGREHLLDPGTRGPGAGPVVLFFWSVYCPNCKEAMPGLVRLYESLRDRGVLVWAINVDGERFSNGVRAYVRDAELPFPVVYDRLEGDYLVAADPLGVTKTPTLYAAGADGKILLRQVIEVDFDAVGRALASREP